MPTLHFDPKSNIVIVEVKLWGSLVTTSRMVFDTGASLVVIPWKVAVALDVKVNSKQTIETTTASTVESAPLVTISKVSVLGERITNVEALVKDLPPMAGVDGLLGLSFIRYFNVKIDFKIGRLTLERIRD